MEAHARDSLKGGIVFAAIGVILALTVPPLLASAAAAMGLAAWVRLGLRRVWNVISPCEVTVRPCVREAAA